MDQLAGSLLFSLIVVGVIVGIWAWLVAFYRKGIRPLLGLDQVIVQNFENVLLYRNGNFERALTHGVHWIRTRNLQLIRSDMRSEVYQFTQGAISSDLCAINLLCVARIQIVEPRIAFESTKNYGNEVLARLQSTVKTVCGQQTRIEIQTEHAHFNSSAKDASNLALRMIGSECSTFELLQAESVGTIVDLGTKAIGFGPH